MSERKLLRMPEAAKLLGNMPVSTFKKLSARREFPVVKIGRSAYYDTADLWTWLEAKKIGQTPRATAVAC